VKRFEMLTKLGNRRFRFSCESEVGGRLSSNALIWNGICADYKCINSPDLAATAVATPGESICFDAS
jgi:hypothetical protein